MQSLDSLVDEALEMEGTDVFCGEDGSDEVDDAYYSFAGQPTVLLAECAFLRLALSLVVDQVSHVFLEQLQFLLPPSVSQFAPVFSDIIHLRFYYKN